MIDNPRLAAFAEDPDPYLAIGPDEERLVTDTAVITISPGGHFWSARVVRVRMDADDVPQQLGEIRDLLRPRGRRAAAWALGPSATPPDLLEQLLSLGLESESETGSDILVLTDPPQIGPCPFEIRRVTTLAEHRDAIEVSIEGFGFPTTDAQDERLRARDTFQAERSGGDVARFVAYAADRPIATLQAWLAEPGVHLSGGATIPSQRRRGAMSALVNAVWEEAVRRATPALVTHANPMAAPRLLQIGFRSFGRVRHLIDRF